ncbi:membrane protein [Microbacterium phage GardenState]|uniref:Membrane protein n=1 Tax=Microbacterium phage GardenState TaxID=2776841 RepID=A0A7L8ZDF6_9CAUD|nr:membrane protein [Microbacterium phage GardenState]
MTSPDYIAPEVALPLAGLLWSIYLLPKIARYNRARRTERKAIR